MKVYSTIRFMDFRGLTLAGLTLAGLTLTGLAPAQAEDLYTLNGKAVSSESLNADQQKQASALTKQATEAFQAAVDKIILNEYFDSQAAAQRSPAMNLNKKPSR